MQKTENQFLSTESYDMNPYLSIAFGPKGIDAFFVENDLRKRM